MTAPSRSSFVLLVALSFVAAIAILLGLRLAVGVSFDAPTFALAAACVVMIWSLHAMWGVVVALSRPAVESLIVEAELAGALGRESVSVAELREEKRRVLRAIKELEFDHAMGKLSDRDFKEIGDRYRLRAIEVIRELQPSEDGELHPLLAEHLAGLQAAAQPAAQPSPKPEATEA